MSKEYELVPHTADLKIYAYGITWEELFRNALRGMFASIKPKSPSIRYVDDEPQIKKFSSERKIVVHSPDRELLLVDFLAS